jgi:NADPH2:quinone reductase
VKALLVEAYGADEVRWIDYPAPEMESGDVLVAVAAVAVDWADVIKRMGKYPGGEQPPFVPNSGFAGTVLQSDDPRFRPGARVFGLARQGAAAEQVVARGWQTFPTPVNLTDVEAAGIVGQFFTADVAVRAFGRLAPGETVLVQAGGGSLGTAAIQLAKAGGAANIVATAGSPDKFPLMKALGATHVVNYREEPFAAVVNSVTEGRGADLIIESVGGDTLTECFDCIAPLGRIVSVGASSLKSSPRYRLHTTFEKNISLAGFSLGEWIGLTRPEVWKDTADYLLRLFAEGKLQAVVGKTFPVTEVLAAHQHLLSRANVGRTVLTIP